MGIELYNQAAHNHNALVSEELTRRLGVNRRDPEEEYKIIQELDKQASVNYDFWGGTSRTERLLQRNIEEFYCPDGGLRGKQKEIVKEKLCDLIYDCAFNDPDPDQMEQLTELYHFLEKNEAVFRY